MRTGPPTLDPAERARALITELGDALVELAATQGGLAGPEPVYSLAETAELLKQSPSTIFRLRKTGHLRTLQYLGRPVVTASEIRRFLAAGNDQGAS